jgi:DNA replication initiation complex subunit (GINS family)
MIPADLVRGTPDRAASPAGRVHRPRPKLETGDRKAPLKLMRQHTPVSRLVSRHTRELLLRRYHKIGKLRTPIADRHVDDGFIDLTADERRLYDTVEDYISQHTAKRLRRSETRSDL